MLPLQMTPPFQGLKLFNPKSKKVFKNDFVSISLKRDISIQGTLFLCPQGVLQMKIRFRWFGKNASYLRGQSHASSLVKHY